jgi:predicted Fe-S protein YdhL (DUF1289 family)
VQQESSGVALDSPCVNICVIDERSGYCLGCGRTIAEIASWRSLTPAERTAIRAELPPRLAEIEEAKAACGSAFPSR